MAAGLHEQRGAVEYVSPEKEWDRSTNISHPDGINANYYSLTQFPHSFSNSCSSLNTSSLDCATGGAKTGDDEASSNQPSTNLTQCDPVASLLGSTSVLPTTVKKDTTYVSPLSYADHAKKDGLG